MNNSNKSKHSNFIVLFNFSFTMAHNFPDLTGKIDVISDAEVCN